MGDWGTMSRQRRWFPSVENLYGWGSLSCVGAKTGESPCIPNCFFPRRTWRRRRSCAIHSERMGSPYRSQVNELLRRRFGETRKLKGSESLLVVGDEAARIYFRYSKVYPGGRTFFGLREVDLRQLEGHNSYLCLLRGDGSPPLFIPYADFEEVFHSAETAKDGQYKVQLYTEGALQLYVARRGRFNVEGYVGLGALESTMSPERLRQAHDLSHSQVQTLLAAVGHLKGYDVWVPDSDVGRLDWSLTARFPLRPTIPSGFETTRTILSEIDVVWVANGRNAVEGLY